MTQWLPYASYFFGSMFLTNAIPHFVSGLMGRAFQSPFARPPGQGLSSSTVNVLWGAANIVIGWLLLCRVGDFNIHSGTHMLTAGLGGLLMSLMLARTFGRFHGGNAALNN